MLLLRVPGTLCQNRRFKSAIAQLAVIRISHGAFGVVGSGPRFIIPHFDVVPHFAVRWSAEEPYRMPDVDWMAWAIPATL